MRASWKAFVGLSLIMFFIMSLLFMLSVFKFQSTLSQLIQSRLTVVAESVADALEGAVDLGLTLSELRTAPDLIARASENDPRIEIIDIVDPDGFIHFSTLSGRAGDFMEPETLEKLRHTDEHAWNHATEMTFLNGVFLTDSIGQRIGAVVLTYSKTEFALKVEALSESLALYIALISAPLIGLGFLGIRVGFRDLDLYMERIDGTMSRLRDSALDVEPEASTVATGDALPDPDDLERKLYAAAYRMGEARSAIDDVFDGASPGPSEGRG